MILSPPFLPTLDADFIKNAGPDPLMDAVDKYESGHSGIYPIAFDGRWHCGTHLNPRKYVPVHAIADGEVVAYSVRQKAISCHRKNHEGTEHLDSNTGFVLLRHTTETGEGRVMTFYSLYMHLLDLDNTRNRVKPMLKMPPEVGSATVLPKWLSYPTDGVQVPANLKVNRKDILGYPGMCQGQPHIHFEIFMTEPDFAAWFEPSMHPIQLGIQSPTTPVSKDYWGHSYFVIPGGQTFISRPPVQKAHAHFFRNCRRVRSA
ncbi:T6SS peptidoglycan binding protein [Cupriavidus sp. U2]|uniref:hypothetical protein n=1 Tax=Cupriavidus sp. U2 TaxID=2920269 RepID=UPI00129D3C37|nr:hypothetical protein [Cupriavidus sp. U2]KAI3593524.1 T6SS peptidoglycan binding protein [Cupriavidus sp. U2]